MKKLQSIFLLAIAFDGCTSHDKPRDFDYGHIENGSYVNSYFDFEMPVPANWVVQTKEQMDSMMNTGKALVAGDDEKMKAAIKASDINAANLLSVFQFEQGADVDYNPNFSVIAENVKNFPGIKTGSDYLAQSRKLMEQSQFKYDHIDKEFSRERIDGVVFYKMKAKVTYLGVEIRQIYYSTVIKGFSFNVIISYINDQQKEDLLKSVHAMKFKK